MRFPILKASPGAIRYIRRFAFVPVRIDDVRIWLEHYYLKQKYAEQYDYHAYEMSPNGKYKWENVRELLPEDKELAPLNRALE